MKFLPRLCGLLLVLACLPSARGQFSAIHVGRIEIKHVGPTAVSDELIRANIRIKEGNTYASRPALEGAIDDDVRNLYATGLFYNIRVTDEPSTNGLALVYLVQ